MLRGYHELRIYCVRMVLSKSGCSGVGVKSVFFQELKERLCSSFYQTWRDHIEASKTFVVYREYRCVFERKKYVLVLRVEGYINAIAQFPMGVFHVTPTAHRFPVVCVF